MRDKKSSFQPVGRSWDQLAGLGGFRAVIDPNDVAGNKNRYIDHIHKAAIRSVVSFEKKMTVLDFGCGIGRLTKYFSDLVDKVVGVDITEKMLDRAMSENNAENIEYFLIDGIHIPLKNDSTDLIVAVYSLQYSVTDAALFGQIMKEFHRVLNKGGMVCFLEQVNKSGTMEKATTKKDYTDGMDPYFILEKAYPVRVGGIQTFSHKAMFKGFIPKALFSWMASREVEATKKLEDKKFIRFSYVDHLFFGHVRK